MSYGLPRRDLPTHMIRAVDPGQLSPSCRRRRSVLGRTNRCSYQRQHRSETLEAISRLPQQQLRARSSLGQRRVGSPYLSDDISGARSHLMGSLVGMSEATTVEMQHAADRSLTPLMSVARFHSAPEDFRVEPKEFAASAQRFGTLTVPRARSSQDGMEQSMRRAATEAPHRTPAAVPPALRATLFSNTPVISSATPLSRSTDPDRIVMNPTKAKGISVFLRSAASHDDVESAGVDPLKRSYVIEPKLRMERSDYHNTSMLTAADTRSGLYAAPAARFDSATRGVCGHSALATEDKEARQHRQLSVIAKLRQRHTELEASRRAEADQAAAREKANTEKRSALRERSAKVARETSEREARLMGHTTLAIPSFLPEYY